MTTEHYNTPADFVVMFTAIGFTVVTLIYVSVTMFGVIRGYFNTASKVP